MKKYLVRRILSGLLVLFLFQTIAFFVVQIIFPGDYASQFVLSLGRSKVQELRMALGLDLPLWQQYFIWLKGLILGEPSFYRDAIVATLLNSLPSTVLVFGTGIFFAYKIGSWAGRKLAWRKSGILTETATLGAILLNTAFPPWIATIILVVYSLFDPNSRLRGAEGQLFWMKSDFARQRVILYVLFILIFLIAIVVLVNWILSLYRKPAIPFWLSTPLVLLFLIGIASILGLGKHTLWVLNDAWFPMLLFTILTFGEFLVITRITMKETLREDYITSCRAKGLPEALIRDRHAGRNVLLPVISKLIAILPTLLGGIVIIEGVTGWQGLGSALFVAVVSQDIFALMPLIVVIGLFSLGLRLLLDVLQAYIDPRVRVIGNRRPE